MSQREIVIKGGPNNTSAFVTGQQELLVKVNSPADVNIVSPIGPENMADSVAVTLAKDYLGAVRYTGMIRATTSDNVNNTVPEFYSVSVANVGSANGTILGGTIIKPGEVLNFSADAINNYFDSFEYNGSGTELLIIFVY